MKHNIPTQHYDNKLKSILNGYPSVVPSSGEQANNVWCCHNTRNVRLPTTLGNANMVAYGKINTRPSPGTCLNISSCPNKTISRAWVASHCEGDNNQPECVTNNVLGAIQVLRNVFFREIGPPPTPRNANNVGIYTFVTLFSGKVDTPPPPSALRNTWMARYGAYKLNTQESLVWCRHII